MLRCVTGEVVVLQGSEKDSKGKGTSYWVGREFGNELYIVGFLCVYIVLYISNYVCFLL